MGYLEEDTYGAQSGHHRGTSVTDEGKRDSGNGHNAYIHADIDKGLHDDPRGDSDRDKFGKPVGRLLRYIKSTIGYNHIGDNDENDPKEAELLG